MTTYVLMRDDDFITGEVCLEPVVFGHEQWAGRVPKLASSPLISNARVFQSEDQVQRFVDKWRGLGSQHLVRVQI